MSYDILYGQGALDQVFALSSLQVVQCVESAMNRLAADPLTLGRRGRALYPSIHGGVFRPQEYSFHCDNVPGQRVHCRAHFHFEQTEREIQVINLIVRPYLVL